MQRARWAVIMNVALALGALAGPALAQQPSAEPPPAAAERDWGEERRDREDRVIVGGSLTIGPEEVVDDAVVIGGSLTIHGQVRGDAVAVGGSVRLESGAVVRGDAVAVGGPLEVAPGAVVRGDRVSVGGSIGDVLGSVLSRTRDWGDQIPWGTLAIIGAILRNIAFLALAVLVLAFAPRRIEHIGHYLAARPVTSLAAGFGLFVAMIPLVVLLAISIIGLPLVPAALLFFVAVLVVGLTSVCVWLGNRLPLFEGRKGPFGALLLGAAMIFLVDLVPFVGGLVVFVAAMMSAGAVLLSRFGDRDAAPSAALPPATIPPGAG